MISAFSFDTFTDLNIHTFTGLNNIVGLIVYVILGSLFTIFFIPLLLGKIKMNRIYGIPLTESYKSDENWYKINKYAASRLIIWSLALVVLGVVILVFAPINNYILFIGAIILPGALFAIPMLDIYGYAKKLQ
jgi:hypothetical protein